MDGRLLESGCKSVPLNGVGIHTRHKQIPFMSGISAGVGEDCSGVGQIVIVPLPDLA